METDMHAMTMAAIIAGVASPVHLSHPTGPRIEEIKAFSFLQVIGSLSGNVLGESFHNAPATSDASESLLITVRVSGVESNKDFIVYTTARQGKKITFSQSAKTTIEYQRRSSIVAFLVPQNQCENVKISVAVKREGVELRKSEEIEYICED